MGLLNKLQTAGSTLTSYDGVTPPTNVGATKSSKLHAYSNIPGYSLSGAFTTEVKSAYTAYDDGVPNALPQPSNLDLNGKNQPKYLDNPPK